MESGASGLRGGASERAPERELRDIRKSVNQRSERTSHPRSDLTSAVCLVLASVWWHTPLACHQKMGEAEGRENRGLSQPEEERRITTGGDPR